MNKSLLPPGMPGTVPRACTPIGGGICFISQKRKVKFLNRPASPPAPTPPQHVLFLGEAVNGGISSTAMDYRWGTSLGYLLFWGHPQLQLSPGRENQLLQPSYLCISTFWFHLGKLACEMHHFIFPRTPPLRTCCPSVRHSRVHCLCWPVRRQSQFSLCLTHVTNFGQQHKQRGGWSPNLLFFPAANIFCAQSL